MVSGAVQGKTVVPKAWYTTYRFENYGYLGESEQIQNMVLGTMVNLQ